MAQNIALLVSKFALFSDFRACAIYLLPIYRERAFWYMSLAGEQDEKLPMSFIEKY